MDDLEFTMNIPQIFEKYPNPDCVLNISLKVGSIQVVRADNVIQINYKLPGKTVSLYKMVIYSDAAEPYYYTFCNNFMEQKKVLMFNHSRENHPEFFEWIIWNLP